MKLSVVVAAYDERANIEPLVRRLDQAIATIPGCSRELIFVVEGRDGTREALERLGLEIAGTRVLYQEQRAGIGAAFRRGFAAVAEDADYVVTLDADLNHQPEEIARLVGSAVRLDADVVVGSRLVAGSRVRGVPLWKRALSRGFNILMDPLFGLEVRDKTSGFRVYRAAVLRGLRFDENEFAFLPELLLVAAAAGYRLAEEPIQFRYREQGRSKMGLWATSFSYLTLLQRRAWQRRTKGKPMLEQKSADTPQGECLIQRRASDVGPILADRQPGERPSQTAEKG
jgi:dolichol-phosphate mannosyltransferase